ncbi:serine/threonine protein phosphatase, partial [Streptomyces anthocyanicus]
MTEHPTSFDRPSTGADPTDPRGALLPAPVPPRASGSALPAQGRTGETPPTAGEDSPGVFEHSQPGAEQAAEPDTHRPRPGAEGVPVQPDGGQPDGGQPG